MCGARVVVRDTGTQTRIKSCEMRGTDDPGQNMCVGLSEGEGKCMTRVR